jgi:hypothetical protein
MKAQSTTSSPSMHLSEDALHDVLIGMGSVESREHLATCESCRWKVQEFSSDLQTFNEASLRLSRSKPLLNLRSLVVTPTAAPWFRSPRWAVALLVLLLLGAATLRYQRHSAPGAGPQPPVLIDNEAQIEEDNQMLRSVEMALNDNVSPIVAEYHLSDSPDSHPKVRMRSKHP